MIELKRYEKRCAVQSAHLFFIKAIGNDYWRVPLLAASIIAFDA